MLIFWLVSLLACCHASLITNSHCSPLHRNPLMIPPWMPCQTESTSAFGLLELAHGESATIDIVALHGLDGHRETSWTANTGVLWLRDLLPARIPNARIFSYGYDVNTHGQDQLSTASLHDQGMNLIAHLASKRGSTATEDRPIIFVAHSLGGIMLKSALIYANACNKDNLLEHKAVEVSTSGILFFGTPHQGSEAASLATVMLNVLSAFGKGTPEIVKDIQSHSKMLQYQLIQYQAISSMFSTKFYIEAYETPVGPVRKLLVPRHSAVVPGAVNAEAVFLNKNHIDMVKFESAADEDFNLVTYHLSIMAKEAPRRISDRWKSQNRAAGTIPEETSTMLGTPREKNSESGNGVVPIEELAPLPQLPYQEGGESFVGRAQALNWIHESFKKHRKLVLYGIGGIGKTGIAVEYVYIHRRDYDIIFWVNGDTSESTTSGFIGIAQQLVTWRSYGSAATSSSFVHNYLHELALGNLVDNRGQVSKKIEDREDILNAIMDWLSRPKSGAWLLIFDNVDDLDSFYLPKFFPRPVVGRILITSRKLESRSLGIGYEVLALSETDSLQLLVHGSKGGEADHAAHEIVRRLEGLPLAIELAAGYIAALQLSYKSYLEFSKESWKFVFTRSTDPYGKSLVATWETSYQAIIIRSPSSANLLLLCAFLNNEVIPEQLFQRKFGASLNEALEHLFAFSLAKRSPLMRSSFSIHPMVHAWARERLDEEQKTEKVMEMAILLGDAISYIYIPWPHISTFADHALEHCLPKLHGASEMSIFQSLETIAERVGGPLFQGMLLLALEATESVEGPDSVQTFTAMNLLGRAYLGFRDLQPGKFLRQALEHEGHGSKPFMLNPNKQRLRAELRRWILPFVGTGIACQDKWSKQWKEGEQLFRRSIVGFENTLGWDHTRTLSATQDLALWFTRRGRFEESLELLQHTVKGYQQILGFYHPQTLLSASYLALTCQQLAEKESRRALKSSERILGLDHPDTLQSVHNLAIILRGPSKLERDEHELGSCLGIQGLHHLDTINYRDRFPGLPLLHRFYDRGEAEEMGRRALEGRERTLGLDHPATLDSVDNLAISLHTLGQLEEAEKMGRRALKSRERILGLDHPDTLRSAHNLAIILRHLGVHLKYRAHQRLLRLSHNPNHVENLAVPLMALGWFEEAEKIGRHAFESRERILGLEHPDTLDSVHKLGISLNELGRSKEAEKMYRRALKSRERILGLDHPDTLMSVDRLFQLLSGLGRLEEAEKMRQRAFESHERSPALVRLIPLVRTLPIGPFINEEGQFQQAHVFDWTQAIVNSSQ